MLTQVISFPSCRDLLTISLIPAARTLMCLTPILIKILPFQACQLFLLEAAWGDPLTMIHSLKLRTICFFGESLSQGEEGSSHSCILFPSKVYRNASNKPQQSGTNLNMADIICHMFLFQWTLFTVTNSFNAISSSLHNVKCQFALLYKLPKILSSHAFHWYLSILISKESIFYYWKISEFNRISSTLITYLIFKQAETR